MEERIGYEIKRVQQALRVRLDEALRDIGLSAAQYAALSFLEEAPGVSSAELARRCFVTPQTMNEIIQRLEKDGLIERSPGQGRILQTALTARGKKRIAQAHGLVAGLEEKMLSRLSTRQRESLLEMLRGCAESLGG